MEGIRSDAAICRTGSDGNAPSAFAGARRTLFGKRHAAWPAHRGAPRRARIRHRASRLCAGAFFGVVSAITVRSDEKSFRSNVAIVEEQHPIVARNRAR